MSADELTELARRLRSHADEIRNPAAAKAMGADMQAAADFIEKQLGRRHLPAGDLLGTLTAPEAMALAQLAKRFTYEDGERFSSRHDGGAERDAMLAGIDKLRRALANAGFAPRGGEGLTMLTTPHDLLVTFSREGEAELTQIVPDGDRALKAALIMLAQQDALRAGDRITVEWHRRPNLIEQGLA